MNYLHLQMKRKDLEWRRDKVIELYCEGRNRSAIAKILHTNYLTVHRDLHFRMQQTKDKAQGYLDKKLPFELEVCRVGLDKVLEKVWEFINNNESSEKSKLQALSLAKDCYTTRLELLVNEIDVHRSMELIFQYNEQQNGIPTSYDKFIHSQTTDYAMSQRKF